MARQWAVSVSEARNCRDTLESSRLASHYDIWHFCLALALALAFALALALALAFGFIPMWMYGLHCFVKKQIAPVEPLTTNGILSCLYFAIVHLHLCICAFFGFALVHLHLNFKSCNTNACSRTMFCRCLPWLVCRIHERGRSGAPFLQQAVLVPNCLWQRVQTGSHHGQTWSLSTHAGIGRWVLAVVSYGSMPL